MNNCTTTTTTTTTTTSGNKDTAYGNQERAEGILSGVKVTVVEERKAGGENRVRYAIEVDPKKYGHVDADLIRRTVEQKMREAEVQAEESEGGSASGSVEQVQEDREVKVGDLGMGELEPEFKKAIVEKRVDRAEAVMERMEKSSEAYRNACKAMIYFSIELKSPELVNKYIDKSLEWESESGEGRGGKAKGDGERPNWVYAPLTSVYGLLETEVRDGKNVQMAEECFGKLSKKSASYYEAWSHLIFGWVNTGDKFFERCYRKAADSYRKILNGRDDMSAYCFASYAMLKGALRKGDWLRAQEYFGNLCEDPCSVFGGVFSKYERTGIGRFIETGKKTSYYESGSWAKTLREACTSMMGAYSERLREIAEEGRGGARIEREKANLYQALSRVIKVRRDNLTSEIIVRLTQGDLAGAESLLVGIRVRENDPVEDAAFIESAMQVGFGYLGQRNFEKADSLFKYGLDASCKSSEQNYARVRAGCEILETSYEGENVDAFKATMMAKREEYKKREQDGYLNEVKRLLGGEVAGEASAIEVEVKKLIEKMTDPLQRAEAVKAIIAFKKFNELKEALASNNFTHTPIIGGGDFRMEEFLVQLNGLINVKRMRAEAGIDRAKAILEKNLKGTLFEAKAIEAIEYEEGADARLIAFCRSFSEMGIECVDMLKGITDVTRRTMAKAVFEKKEPELYWHVFLVAEKEGDVLGMAMYLGFLKGTQYENEAKEKFNAYMKEKVSAFLATKDVDGAAEYMRSAYGNDVFKEMVGAFLEGCIEVQRWDIVGPYLVMIRHLVVEDAADTDFYADLCAGVVEGIFDEGNFEAVWPWFEQLRDLGGGRVAADVLMEYMKIVRKHGESGTMMMMKLSREVHREETKASQETKQVCRALMLEHWRENFERYMSAREIDRAEKLFFDVRDFWMLERLIKEVVKAKDWERLEKYKAVLGEKEISNNQCARMCEPALKLCYDEGKLDEAFEWLSMIRDIDSRGKVGGFFLQPYFELLLKAIEAKQVDFVKKLMGMANERIKEFKSREEIEEAEKKQKSEAQKGSGKKHKKTQKNVVVRPIATTRMVPMRESERVRRFIELNGGDRSELAYWDDRVYALRDVPEGEGAQVFEGEVGLRGIFDFAERFLANPDLRIGYEVLDVDAFEKKLRGWKKPEFSDVDSGTDMPVDDDAVW